MTPKEYLQIRGDQAVVMIEAQQIINDAMNEAWNCPVPKNIRPSTIEDVKPNAILWYPNADEGHPKWTIVDGLIEPERPREPEFKWYYSEGARYGINGAFVEVE